MPQSKPISRKDCTSKMQLRSAFVSKKFEDIAEQAGLGTPTYNYFAPISGRQQRNAYVFSTESVFEILFGTTDISQILTDTAIANKHKWPTSILAIMGAHHKDEDDFLKGQPTVILIGAKETNPDTGDYQTVLPKSILPEKNKGAEQATGADEIVGAEFPPSLLIENPPQNVAQKNNFTSAHGFKII